MKLKLITVAAFSAFALVACGEKDDKTVDRGYDAKDLSELVAGIWVDPHGCDHWIIDDGVEGYLSARLQDNGKPVCSGNGIPNTASGPYKSGGAGDLIF